MIQAIKIAMFNGHGNYSFTIEAPVLYLELYDAFNEEGAFQFRQAMLAEYQQHPTQLINHAIVNLQNWQLGTPESQQQARKMFQSMAERGYQQVDYLVNGNIIGQFILAKLWQGIKVNVTFHASTADFLALFPHFDALITQHQCTQNKQRR